MDEVLRGFVGNRILGMLVTGLRAPKRYDGTPGIAARDRAQDFTNGKVFRRRTVPAPRKIFNVDHWVVVDNVNGAQCGAGTSPPPVPYPVEDPGSKPSKPTNGKPSSPSKGKGGKGGKGKYWRRK